MNRAITRHVQHLQRTPVYRAMKPHSDSATSPSPASLTAPARSDVWESQSHRTWTAQWPNTDPLPLRADSVSVAASTAGRRYTEETRLEAFRRHDQPRRGRPALSTCMQPTRLPATSTDRRRDTQSTLEMNDGTLLWYTVRQLPRSKDIIPRYGVAALQPSYPQTNLLACSQQSRT